MPRRRPTPRGPRPLDPPKPACWRVWRPSGAGGPSGRRTGKPSRDPTSGARRCPRCWDIEMREVPMSPGSYAMDPASMLERVDENTIMVVPTFGVTYTGAYEPVEALAKALDQLQADTGLD